jgi:hypothetical protein
MVFGVGDFDRFMGLCWLYCCPGAYLEFPMNREYPRSKVIIESKPPLPEEAFWKEYDVKSQSRVGVRSLVWGSSS